MNSQEYLFYFFLYVTSGAHLFLKKGGGGGMSLKERVPLSDREVHVEVACHLQALCGRVALGLLCSF